MASELNKARNNAPMAFTHSRPTAPYTLKTSSYSLSTAGPSLSFPTCHDCGFSWACSPCCPSCHSLGSCRNLRRHNHGGDHSCIRPCQAACPSACDGKTQHAALGRILLPKYLLSGQHTCSADCSTTTRATICAGKDGRCFAMSRQRSSFLLSFHTCARSQL